MINAVSPTFSASLVRTMRSVPYEITRKRLYNADDLYAGIANNPTGYYDARVYAHFLKTGKIAKSPYEQAARTLHDYAIHRAMREFLTLHTPTKTVGIMGGHQLKRTEPMFRQIAELAKQLTEQGFLMVTGGGPGAMEATHLGAWMAGRTQAEMDEAIMMLQMAPTFKDEGWVLSALDVMRLFPQRRLPYADRLRYHFESLAIPTWLYGHEPATPFATHIAKFFDNSIREDAVLSVCYGGIVFTPGSAGTLQEIFQDAVQNHYLSLGLASPMIFLGTSFWEQEVPVYPFMEDMIRRGNYKNMQIALSDSNEEIIQVLTQFAAKIEKCRE